MSELHLCHFAHFAHFTCHAQSRIALMAQTHLVGAEGTNSYKFSLGGTELSMSWSTNKLQIALSSSACEIHEILTRARPRHETYGKNSLDFDSFRHEWLMSL